jgi:hypothetical protein
MSKKKVKAKKNFCQIQKTGPKPAGATLACATKPWRSGAAARRSCKRLQKKWTHQGEQYIQTVSILETVELHKKQNPSAGTTIAYAKKPWCRRVNALLIRNELLQILQQLKKNYRLKVFLHNPKRNTKRKPITQNKPKHKHKPNTQNKPQRKHCRGSPRGCPPELQGAWQRDEF